MDEFPARYKHAWQPVATPLALQCWLRWDDTTVPDDGPFPVLMFLVQVMSVEADAKHEHVIQQREGKTAIHWWEYREPDEFTYSFDREWDYVEKAVVLATPPGWDSDTFLIKGGDGYQVWWDKPPPREKEA